MSAVLHYISCTPCLKKKIAEGVFPQLGFGFDTAAITSGLCDGSMLRPSSSSTKKLIKWDYLGAFQHIFAAGHRQLRELYNEYI